jgi:DNA-binding response OmpR family regulator
MWLLFACVSGPKKSGVDLRESNLRVSNVRDSNVRETRAPDPNYRASILAMDSDADIRELLRLHLTAAGYEVRLAKDPVDAGHQVLERFPDLLIADISVPYMSGVEFVNALRADETLPRFPVILLATVEENAEHAKWMRGYPVLTKPMVADQLIACVAHELRTNGAGAPRADPPADPGLNGGR